MIVDSNISDRRHIKFILNNLHSYHKRYSKQKLHYINDVMFMYINQFDSYLYNSYMGC